MTAQDLCEVSNALLKMSEEAFKNGDHALRFEINKTQEAVSQLADFIVDRDNS